MELVLYWLALLVCFYLIAIVSDKYFVEALEKISKKMKLSSEITWATFMAIWSSAPELFTSIFAVFAIFGSWGNENIWAGTIVWSAIFNVLIIVWVSLIVAKANQKLYRQPIIRDLIFYALTILLLLWVFWDGQIFLWETICFVVLYLIYLRIVTQWAKWLNYNVDENVLKDVEENVSENKLTKCVSYILDWIIPNSKNYYWWTFFVSILLIGILSHQMVHYAVEISGILNIPAAIVWLTILAAWTSIPDLISSVIVAKKWYVDMSVSNAFWSNIFDILIWLGAVYFVYFLIYFWAEPIAVDQHNLIWSVVLLFASVFVMIAILILRKWKTSKWIGWLLIFLYCIYLTYNIYLVV